MTCLGTRSRDVGLQLNPALGTPDVGPRRDGWWRLLHPQTGRVQNRSHLVVLKAKFETLPLPGGGCAHRLLRESRHHPELLGQTHLAKTEVETDRCVVLTNPLSPAASTSRGCGPNFVGTSISAHRGRMHE